ncbi:hypothetical protein [Paraburkholderia sp.]|uniref:hypothetical protein n=1 Tax=Paraburkholderia sp. TaxID=1926495 RepID=UPI003D6E037A
MKLLRTFLLLLLCVTLPISGLAASGLAGDCPMQQTIAMHDDGSVSTSMPGCDSMKSSPDGKTKVGFCKMTAQCQFGSLYHPGVVATVGRPAAPHSQLVFHYSQSLSIRAPDGLWRPPRSL